MDEFLRVHNVVLHTKVLGPEQRAAIWLQGCERRCKGCMSPMTRDLNGGQLIEIEKIVSEITGLTDIEGITISGGEPFLQSGALCHFLNKIREAADLGVIIYTGYTIEELHALNNNHIEEILSGLADLIIDGEYVEELNDGKSLKGSSNQRLIFLTDRYKASESCYQGKKRNVEIIASNKDLFFIGIPNEKMFKEWEKVAKTFGDMKTKERD